MRTTALNLWDVEKQDRLRSVLDWWLDLAKIGASEQRGLTMAQEDLEREHAEALAALARALGEMLAARNFGGLLADFVETNGALLLRAVEGYDDRPEWAEKDSFYNWVQDIFASSDLYNEVTRPLDVVLHTWLSKHLPEEYLE